MLTHRRDPRAAALRALLLGALVPATALAEPPSAPLAPTAGASAPASVTIKGADAATLDATTGSRDHEASLGELGSLSGATGLLHMAHAEASEPGQIRIALIAEGFSAGFLCTSSYPCPALKTGGPAITIDRMNHLGGTVSLGASIARIGPGIVEAHASSEWMLNSDNADRTSSMTVAGDTTLGLKYVARLSSRFHVGGLAEAILVNGNGSGGLNWGATSGRFTGLSTLDLREGGRPLPLRISATLGYTLDNTGVAITPIEVPFAQGGVGGPLTRIERYGLGAMRTDHIDLHVGVEALLVRARVRPFLEYGVTVAAVRGSGQFTCNPANVSRDQCLSSNFVAPSSVTLGARFVPWNAGLALTAALDVGVTGTNSFIQEVVPVPPWVAYVGAGWTFDTASHAAVDTSALERATVRRNIYGLVHEKGRTVPVPGAVITYEDHPELTAQLTARDGHFVSPELKEETVLISVKANGYRPLVTEIAVTRGATVVPFDCALEALPREGALSGRLREAETNAPLSDITVQWLDSEKRERAAKTDASGAYRFDGLPAGSGELRVRAEGYLDLESSVTVEPQTERTTDLSLHAKPRPGAVKISTNEVIILRPLHFLFARDSAVIVPESYGVLTDVANAFIRETRIRKFEVQGHTDDRGTPEHNKNLSEQRALAVRQWLAEHGVAADRMVAKGYGQELPIAPNKTPDGRAENRRVQFVVVDEETDSRAR